MCVQNQTGQHPRKWDKTGRIVEVRQFDQYVVKVDGSGRVTLRNRKFLRRYNPVYPRSHPADDLRHPAHGHDPGQGLPRMDVLPTATTPPTSPVPATEGSSTMPPRAAVPVTAAPTDHHDLAPTNEPGPAAPGATTAVPPRSPPDPSATPSPSCAGPPPVLPKVPRMLARLVPHNKPGHAEQLTPPTPPPLVSDDPAPESPRRSSRLAAKDGGST